MSGFVTVVLAAGKGTRMKSSLPKVLHQIGGKPMVQHVLTAAQKAGAVKNIVVIGFGADSVRESIGSQAEYVVQAEQLGTGHAVMQAREPLAGFDQVQSWCCAAIRRFSGQNCWPISTRTHRQSGGCRHCAYGEDAQPYRLWPGHSGSSRQSSENCRTERRQPGGIGCG